MLEFLPCTLPTPTDLLSFGDPLVAIWAEDPNGAGVDGNPVLAWPNAGSLGGAFAPVGAGSVIYDRFAYPRPAFLENGAFLSLTTAVQAHPGTLVAVFAVNLLTTPNGVPAAYVDSALAAALGLATAGDGGLPAVGPSISTTFAGSVGGGGGHSNWQPISQITTLIGSAVVGANEVYSINGGPLFDTGVAVPAGESADTFTLLAAPGGLLPLTAGAVFFAAYYPTATEPAGLADAIQAHYGPIAP